MEPSSPRTAPAESGPADTDWRRRIPEPRRRLIRLWFWSIAATTLAVLIVGGVTRLTHSGLSIVDWDPIMGVVPPLTEAQWAETFERYRQFPEYQKLRQGMSLQEFRFIFFWEYLHRVLARLIGVVFLVPFAFMAVRRWFSRPLATRALLLFGLGAMQGLMGWLMVASGLVDRPSVSHFRLAAHLTLAFLIFGGAVWMARELSPAPERLTAGGGDRRRRIRGIAWIGGLLAAQVVWGAFVAGLKAGFVLNTFPLMAGGLLPPGFLNMEPAILNFVENPVTVQWTHRVIGTLLALAVVAVCVPLLRRPVDAGSRRFAGAMLALMLLQYLLGVLTLLLRVPVALGVAHQALAMVIFGLWVAWLHHARHLNTGAPTAELRSAVDGSPGAPGPAMDPVA